MNDRPLMTAAATTVNVAPSDMAPHPVVSPAIGTAVRVVCALVGVPVFALSVVVQHNDPDPLPWMAIYASAALLCAARALGRVVVVPAGVVAVVASVWMLILTPAAVAWLKSDHEAIAFTMKTGDAGEELAREAGGLGLVALAAVLLVVEGRRHRGG